MRVHAAMRMTAHYKTMHRCSLTSSFQRLFEENRNAEMVETQRLEEQERRRREEKVRSRERR